MDNVQIAANQILRGLVLNITREADPLGASAELIRAILKQHGHSLDKSDVKGICKYLEGKGLVKINGTKNEVLKVSRFIAYITPTGIDVLEGTIQIEGIELAVD